MKRLTKVIELTDDQREELAPLFLALREYNKLSNDEQVGLIAAQVYGDGMHVGVLTYEEGAALYKTMYGGLSGRGKSRSLEERRNRSKAES